MVGIDSVARHLLDRRFIGALGTVNPDKSVHMVAIWYLLDGDRLLIPTSSSSRKTANVLNTPTATLMVDQRSAQSMSGVVVKGRASVIDGQEALDVNERIHRRYLSDSAFQDPSVTRVFRGDDVTLLIECDSVTTWDMAAAMPQIFGDPGYLRDITN